MKGIYISVPDSEFSFFMSLLGKFKSATVIKTDEFILNQETEATLLPWQLDEIKLALEEEKQHPNAHLEAKEFISNLRNRRNV